MVFGCVILGLAAATVGSGCVADENGRLPELVSLFCGFGPLIGLFVLQAVLAVIFALLVCSAEQTFSDEDTAIPRRTKQRPRYSVGICYVSRISRSLSLKEHSPPVSPILCY